MSLFAIRILLRNTFPIQLLAVILHSLMTDWLFMNFFEIFTGRLILCIFDFLIADFAYLLVTDFSAKNKHRYKVDLTLLLIKLLVLPQSICRLMSTCCTVYNSNSTSFRVWLVCFLQDIQIQKSGGQSWSMLQPYTSRLSGDNNKSRSCLCIKVRYL